MKLYRKRDLKRCGIYAIRNKINNKYYIGKSINIYERIRQHINKLNKTSKDSNFHLNKSWLKYGRNNFEYIILEDIELNDDLLKQQELYWILKLKTNQREFGYNLRLDSKTKCILTEETKQRMSKGTLLYYKNNPEALIEIGKKSSKFWKENPEIKFQMAKKVSKAKHKYKIQQFDKQMNFIKEWFSVEDIIKVNPNYKWQNIYAVCNGYKPSMYSYVWRKIKI